MVFNKKVTVNLHVEALNLRHLRAWLTVVNEGSVTAGAQKLGVSQPCLSQQIKSLEDFFGKKLLERLHHGVQPSSLGRALLGDARTTLSAATRLARKARGISGLEIGTLEIATLPSLVDAIMIDPIRRWQAEYPEVAIHIAEFPQQSVMTESVAMGEGDLAIGVRPPKWLGPVISLGWEQFVVVLPANDPLAGNTESVVLAELADRNWVLYESSNGLADYVSYACALSGFVPKKTVVTSQVQVAVHLATAGLGAVLVPAMNVPLELEHSALPLNPPIAWELTAFTRSELSPPAEAFIKILSDRKWLSLPANAIVLPGS